LRIETPSPDLLVYIDMQASPTCVAISHCGSLWALA
jgi:hypothetical protein